MVSKPNLLLHVGSHKTGTTAIQGALASNRKVLLNSGVHYPSIKPEFKKEASAHHKIAHAAAHFSPDDRNRLRRFEDRIFLNSKKVGLTIISAEPIYRHIVLGAGKEDLDDWFAAHREYLRRLAEIFSRFKIKPVCFFRKPDEVAISLYKENVVRRNARGDLEGFLSSHQHFFDYSRHLDALQNCFGAVDVRIFEEERKKQLTDSLAPLSIMTGCDIRSHKNLRTSPSDRATLWLRNTLPDLTDQGYLRRVIFALRMSTSGVFADSEGSTLWESRQQHADFCSKFQRSYEPHFPFEQQECNPNTVFWTDEMQKDANLSFDEWENENLSLLEFRENAKLPFYMPDPAEHEFAAKRIWQWRRNKSHK